MILAAPDNRKVVEVAGTKFHRHKDGYFEIPNETIFCEPLLAQGFTEYKAPANPGAVQVSRDDIKAAEFHAVVIRCLCGEPSAHEGQPCPKGRAENLGKIAAFYRNPIKRLAWKLQQTFRG